MPQERRPALLLAATIAFTPLAADADVLLTKGEIASIDPQSRQISLADGRVFVASPKVKLSTRTVGEKIIIVYEVANGEMRVKKLRRMPAFLDSYIPEAEPESRAEGE